MVDRLWLPPPFILRAPHTACAWAEAPTHGFWPSHFPKSTAELPEKIKSNAFRFVNVNRTGSLHKPWVLRAPQYSKLITVITHLAMACLPSQGGQGIMAVLTLGDSELVKSPVLWTGGPLYKSTEFGTAGRRAPSGIQLLGGWWPQLKILSQDPGLSPLMSSQQFQ